MTIEEFDKELRALIEKFPESDDVSLICFRGNKTKDGGYQGTQSLRGSKVNISTNFMNALEDLKVMRHPIAIAVSYVASIDAEFMNEMKFSLGFAERGAGAHINN